MLRTTTLAALLLTFATPTLASPQAPPSPYLVEAAKHLIPTQTARTFDAYSGEMASDLIVWLDGQKIASDKVSWLEMERRKLGKVDRRVIGYAHGTDSIIVFDVFDDRSDLPDNPMMLFHPLLITRSVKYQFGPDHKVHAIRITQTVGIFQKQS